MDMYEDDVRALIEKIQHGDFNLTDNEAFLLVYDNAVNATFSKLASAGKVNWDQVIKCVGKYGNLETLVFNEDNNFYDDMAALAAARYCLNDYDFRTIEISSNYFSPEVYEQIQEESYQKIINSSNPRKKIMFSTSLFIRLLNEKLI